MLSSCVMFEGVLAFLFGAGIFSCLNIVMFRMCSVKMQGDISAVRFSVTSAAGGFVAILCLFRWNMNCQRIIAYVFLCVLIMTAYVDGKMKKILNVFVILAAAIAVVSVPFFPAVNIVERGVGMLCVSVPLLLITLIVPGSFGGGDIKLMAAGGLYLGWRGTVHAFVAAILLAGIYCIGMMAAGRMNRKSQIALGPFLCLGIVIAMLEID